MPNKAGFRPGPGERLDNVAAIGTPGSATTEQVADVVNALIQELIDTGYMESA